MCGGGAGRRPFCVPYAALPLGSYWTENSLSSPASTSMIVFFRAAILRAGSVDSSSAVRSATDGSDMRSGNATRSVQCASVWAIRGN